jgi:hypothetical protein
MITKHLSLSAFDPIKLAYKYSTTGDLKAEYKEFRNGMRYYDHDALKQFADVSLSNESALILTRTLSLNSIFEEQQKILSVSELCGMFVLFTKDTPFLGGDNEVNYFNGQFCIGGKGEQAIFSIVPATDNKVYLRVNYKRVQVAEQYPYEVYLSNDKLPDNESNRELFDVAYRNKKFTIKTQTKEGTRFLSFGTDRILRGVGLELNKSIINPYHFDVEFLSFSSIAYGSDYDTKEVKYYNTNESLLEKKALNVKAYKGQNTNILFDFPVIQTQTTTNVGVNMAVLKTNFTSTGTFNSSLSSQ